MARILAQPCFELRWVGWAAPIIRQRLDLQSEGLGAQAPVQRKIAALGDQHLVPWGEQIDQRRFPRAVPGRSIAEDWLLGLEDALQAGEALLGDFLERGAGEVERAAIHCPQNAIR